MSSSRRGGVVIGRFMPPHIGHRYLIEFARSYARELTVFVCTLSTEPIPGELRFAWMSRLFPDVHLVHVTEEIPEASRSSAGAHAIWARAIRARLDTDPKYVFASETYGLDLASELGAEFVPVDPHRAVFPISAGAIREDPYRHWACIPSIVRPYFARKIAVIESSGSLVRELANEHETVFATEYPSYVRSLDLAGPMPRSATELARAQAASEEALLQQANKVLFTPNDPLLILVEADLPEEERERVLAELSAEYPYLSPTVVVAAEPVSKTYRDAARAHGRHLVEASGRAAARDLVETELERLLGKKRGSQIRLTKI
ncbi:MAG: adenylyltransferase/cytidyltransferase family protein [Spirochaetota bacterium]